MIKTKGFLPYILIIFFNAFIDLGHKILIQNTLYQTSDATHFSLMSSIVNALILLPYLFLFTPSGFIADKFRKANVLRITAAAAIPLTLIATWSYYQGYFEMAFAMTLLLAAQSALNSPAKYGYIKEIFGKSNIARANAVVQTVAILSILAGTFIFSIIFNHYLQKYMLMHSVDRSAILKAFAPAGILLVICSCAETICTFIIPQKLPADPSSHFQVNQYAKGIYLKRYLKEVNHTPVILLCILGLSIFWGINQVLLASYGAYLKEFAGNPSTVFVQGALAMGGIGILLGASYAGRVSRGYIETGLIPFAAIGISIGLFILPHVTNHIVILGLFLFYGFFGGMLVVPLNALIQFNAKDSHLGKVMATNNFIQTVFMLGFLVVNIIFMKLGGNILYFLYGLFVIAVAGTFFSIYRLPQALMRYLLYFIVSKIYGVKVDGLDNMPSTGGLLLLGNHTSFLDWAILQIASPRPIRFVMERSISEKWYLKWIMHKLKVIPISRGASKGSLEAINLALKAGDVVALFPEGRLSRNGQIGHFNTGFERAAQDSNAQIIPFYLLGLWGTKSSYATSRYKTLSKSKHRRVSVTFGEPLSESTDAVALKQKVAELSIRAWKNYIGSLGTIAEEWLKRVKQIPNTRCLTDSIGIKLTHSQLLSTVMYMEEEFSPQLIGQQNIGLLLPPGAAGIIANLTVLCLGKTIVNLNYTTSVANLLSALQDASVKTIITARPFIKKLKAKGYDLTALLHDVKVIYIEDYKTSTTKYSIIRNFILVKILPVFLLKRLVLANQDNNRTAAILFSSGSESKPKGIELTHRNILGNAKQISSVFNIEDHDVVLSSLPLFHAFGLTATTIMPLVEGTPMVCHPDPTDAVRIGKLIYKHKVTVMCGTSTFFGLYCRNRKCLPQMLESLRLVIAGAEKLSHRIRQEFKLKFNLDIYEGYGATEVAPVASSNLPDALNSDDWHVQQANKVGTVGLALPGSAFKIVDPDTYDALPIGSEGMVLIGGTQVMKGYLNNPEKTARVLICEDHITWYITGDKGVIDADGFLTIVDRYSRFAKIGGEMVSLSSIEQRCEAAIDNPDIELMAVAIPDAKKGEKIVVLHTGSIDPAAMREAITKEAGNNLLVPASYIQVDELPKLGSGKKDYVTAKHLVLD
ncbi:MAG: acyl-[ACP]--phospholipid O-acyltransferase [Coxiella sp. (in: Bacteria)]|nr:MAG: acyl-[ACP]--phospholipid O-acyltransferase [Coxiella sp. (in: g-proteobacteria)]